MSWSLVTSTFKSGYASAVTTSALDTTGADLIVVQSFAGYANSTPPVITDSKGNTWTKLTPQNDAVPCCMVFYYCSNPTVGAGHTFTGTCTGNQNQNIAVQAWSGSAASPFDVQNGLANGGYVGSSTIQAGSITPSVNGELIVAGCGSYNYDQSGSATINDGFTVVGSDYTGASGNAYFVQTTAAAINPTWTWHDFYIGIAVIASFKAAAAATGSLFRQMPMTGLGTGGPFFANPIG